MKVENILSLALAGAAVYYILQSRKQQTYVENAQMRAQRMTDRGGRPNLWGESGGRVFDWIEYRMTPGAGGNRERQPQRL